MTDEELKQLVESNARTIQAMLDSQAEDRQQFREGMEQLQQGMIQLQNVVDRLTNVQEGIANLLASLDQDRPTILRKLSTIESKVDLLLEQRKENESG